MNYSIIIDFRYYPRTQILPASTTPLVTYLEGWLAGWMSGWLLTGWLANKIVPQKTNNRIRPTEYQP